MLRGRGGWVWCHTVICSGPLEQTPKPYTQNPKPPSAPRLMGTLASCTCAVHGMKPLTAATLALTACRGKEAAAQIPCVALEACNGASQAESLSRARLEGSAAERVHARLPAAQARERTAPARGRHGDAQLHAGSAGLGQRCAAEAEAGQLPSTAAAKEVAVQRAAGQRGGREHVLGGTDGICTGAGRGRARQPCVACRSCKPTHGMTQHARVGMPSGAVDTCLPNRHAGTMRVGLCVNAAQETASQSPSGQKTPLSCPMNVPWPPIRHILL